MKKVLVVLILLASVTTIFVGCDFFFKEETYFFDSRDDQGTCVSLTTNDAKFKTAVSVAGWEVGSCPTEDSLGECGGFNQIPKDQAEKFGEGDSASVEQVVDIINALINDGTSLGVAYYPKSISEEYDEVISAGDESPEAVDAAKEEANKELTELCSEIGGTWKPNEILKTE